MAETDAAVTTAYAMDASTMDNLTTDAPAYMCQENTHFGDPFMQLQLVFCPHHKHWSSLQESITFMVDLQDGRMHLHRRP